MERKEVKIKSYLYLQQNLLILLAIMFGIPTILVAILLKPFSVGAVVSIGSFATIFLIGALITRLGCRTYDIYSTLGMQRVRGNKIIFDIKWDNVKSALYYGLGDIIALKPCILNIDLNEPLVHNEDRSYDNTTHITTPMSKKTVKQIAMLMPIEIKNMPKK